MSPGGQAKLLRVLEQKVITRVGGSQSIPINVRVIAATNADLDDLVNQKRFRQDLYYRLSVFPVELPPLRKRSEDIPLLAEHFLSLSARKLGRPVPRLTLAAVHRLQHYPWPGNVRELQHVIERSVITAERGRLAIDLPTGKVESPTPSPQPGPVAADRVLTDAEVRKLEADNIRAALRQANGKVSGPGGAAERLGLRPTTLASRIKALGIGRGRVDLESGNADDRITGRSEA
jgi:transcriptional regulator with GAF, ATPase, and Fis domain